MSHAQFFSGIHDINVIQDHLMYGTGKGISILYDVLFNLHYHNNAISGFGSVVVHKPYNHIQPEGILLFPVNFIPLVDIH